MQCMADAHLLQEEGLSSAATWLTAKVLLLPTENAEPKFDLLDEHIRLTVLAPFGSLNADPWQLSSLGNSTVTS